MADGTFATLPKRRTVLLLQGPASWFFLRLARALETGGARVLRILFCPGDRLFWGVRAGLPYRGGAEEFADWLATVMRRETVTDLVCLGDGRDLHRTGIAVARDLGVGVHVVEQGYLRPHRLTVDPGGLGIRSAIWQTREELRRPMEERAAPACHAFRAPFLGYAAMDVAWNLANLAASWAFWPRYRRHGLDHPLREWAGWAIRMAVAPWTAVRDRHVRAEIAAWPGPVFLLPLQLETDFAVRRDGPPGGVAGVLDHVVDSFARAAPRDALLVVKRHPLDHGLDGWHRRARRSARKHGTAERTRYLNAGPVEPLIAQAAGVITINSTVGLTALAAGCPVKALGQAVYGAPRMTDPASLESFLRAPEPPDMAVVSRFLARLAEEIQVPGGFDGTGAETGARAVAARVLSSAPAPSP